MSLRGAAAHGGVVGGAVTRGRVGDVAAGADEAHDVGIEAEPPLQVHLLPATRNPLTLGPSPSLGTTGIRHRVCKRGIRHAFRGLQQLWACSGAHLKRRRASGSAVTSPSSCRILTAMGAQW